MNKLGVLIGLYPETNVLEEMETLKALGAECCQITVWNNDCYTDEKAEEIKQAVAKTGVEVSTLWAGWSGPTAWNFTEGPSTLGLVPIAFRNKRTEDILLGVDFAAKIGAPRLATHVGFLPENMNDPQFSDLVAILRYIARKCKEKNVCFLFETGQETPVTLLRFIEEIGMDNVGINMDTANLILYGKANSADAITVFGKYVMDTHIKDGFYPTNGKSLGKEVKVGDGLANIPEVVKRLKAVNYQGNYIIEREISGEQQTKDIKETLEYLSNILSNSH